MSFIRKTVETINRCYTTVLIIGGRCLYRRQYKKLLRSHPVGKIERESEYLAKWRHLSRKPHVAPFRLFSQYTGADPNIVPEDISATIIQPLLNPIEYRPYYQDKNMFDKILSPEIMPVTLLRGMHGKSFDVKYRSTEDVKSIISKICREEERIFIKPSVNSSSGDAVIGFNRADDGLLHSLKDGTVFDENWLNNYKKDNPNYILQRGLKQHKDVAFYNTSSINTIRVVTYRSVTDEKSHFLRAVIRIGKRGAFVDNAHAGGVFVGIDCNGILGKYACDQYGNRYDSFNGIDFNGTCHFIPHFEQIIQFAEKVASQIHHARLVAQDICLQDNGEPCLIEFNLRAFAPWVFQFVSGSVFGKYTDEIINYCVQNRKNVKKVFVEPF